MDSSRTKMSLVSTRSLKSSKQDTVADSTTEAEYIAASNAEKGVVWIKKFISELGIVPSIVDPIGLYYDNNGAIAQAKEPRSHQRSKHILRRYHLIREIIDRGDVKICKVPTLDNIVDPLTKPLAQQKHDGHARSMGIRVETLQALLRKEVHPILIAVTEGATAPHLSGVTPSQGQFYVATPHLPAYGPPSGCHHQHPLDIPPQNHQSQVRNKNQNKGNKYHNDPIPVPYSKLYPQLIHNALVTPRALTPTSPYLP
ncbi:hypothetical protein KIW84_062600 [Lathyrus oleraceus]|uniref:Uncharacterized protein n=1 Tax=Pisum sativum TaxID=3888 RepID=A0A9D4W8V2_PEA|nr:hypothetical protein KIW84_062600 [Pisum sativum]